MGRANLKPPLLRKSDVLKLTPPRFPFLLFQEYSGKSWERPDLGLNPGKSALTGFTWVEKCGLGGLDLFCVVVVVSLGFLVVEVVVIEVLVEVSGSYWC